MGLETGLRRPFGNDVGHGLRPHIAAAAAIAARKVNDTHRRQLTLLVLNGALQINQSALVGALVDDARDLRLGPNPSFLGQGAV